MALLIKKLIKNFPNFSPTLTKKLKEYSVKISTIARGIPIGGDLEYTDEITLGRSIVGRIVYE